MRVRAVRGLISQRTRSSRWMQLTLVSLCVIQSSRSGSFLPRTTPESPTWPMYSLESRRKQTVAVVPAVEGKPEAVLGQPAEDH